MTARLFIGLFVAATFLGALGCASHRPTEREQDDRLNATMDSEGWRADFHLGARALLSSGRNDFFILEPGYRAVLKSDDAKLTVTVLNETVQVDGVETRVVEEREEEDGQLVEISRNFFAICEETHDVFYFGEEVDIYRKGKIVNHEGAWRAGENGAKAGLIMPGKPAVGLKYYQEVAPGVAMDRAEIVSITETLATPAGTLDRCLKIKEGSGLKPTEQEYKMYAPGIGLIQDEDLLLVEHGFIGKP